MDNIVERLAYSRTADIDDSADIDPAVADKDSDPGLFRGNVDLRRILLLRDHGSATIDNSAVASITAPLACATVSGCLSDLVRAAT